MIHYILQILFFQLIFLLAYELLLKKETFFSYNRWYLLLTPVISLLLPLLKIESLATAIPPETFVMLPEVVIGGNTATPETAEAVTTASEGLQVNWWLLTYGLGVLASFVLFIKKYRILKSLFRNKVISTDKDFRIIQVPDSNLACTFFNTIFLGDRLSEEEIQQILSHELVHVRQKHSADLLFFELFKILFWFNPLIYIYQSRISTLHEFIADAGVVKTVEKQTYYQQLLNTAFSTQNISFINQFFNHSLIKKRILMLQKSRSKTISKFKYLIMVPLMLAMLTYVSCSEDPVQNPEENSLSEYTYTLDKGGEMSAATKAKHDRYEDFLINNPNHVGWASIDRTNDEVTYSIHSKEETIPEGYRKLDFNTPDGNSYTLFINIKGSDSKAAKASEVDIEVLDNSHGSGDVPFAVIEEVPVFPGCEGLESNQARKDCMTENVTQHVNANFNTSLGKELGLEGVNRIYVQFKITTDGNVEVLGARAPHPALQEEAERVVNTLPQMTPGLQKGQKVGVLYSLPITFRVGE